MLKNKIIRSIFVVLLLLLSGYSESVPVNTSVEYLENIISTEDINEVPSNALSPTPIPTEVMVYDKIFAWKTSK